MTKKLAFLTFLIFFTLSVVAIYQFFKFNDGKLHLVFCDVGQGDAIFIRTSTGSNILIDGGPDDSVLNCLSRHLPFWDKTLQAVILTHPHADHFTGLISVMKRYNLISYDTENLQNPGLGAKILQDKLALKNLSATYVKKGDRLSNKANFSIEILWPSQEFVENSNKNSSKSGFDLDLNGFSVISLVTYGNFKVLLTADAASAVDEKAGKESGDVDVLEVPHHGSKTGLSQFFLEETKPKLAVISVGKNNKYGHPSQAALSLLKNNKIKSLRTDQAGDIEIVSDGKSWWLIN